MLPRLTMRIRKDDIVQVMVGKDRGKSGKVLVVDQKNERLMVAGVNMYKKHKRPTKQGEKGQIISLTRSLPVANVQLLCTGCGKPTRLGYRFVGEVKSRICKKCGVAV